MLVPTTVTRDSHTQDMLESVTMVIVGRVVGKYVGAYNSIDLRVHRMC